MRPRIDLIRAAANPRSRRSLAEQNGGAVSVLPDHPVTQCDV